MTPERQKLYAMADALVAEMERQQCYAVSSQGRVLRLESRASPSAALTLVPLDDDGYRPNLNNAAVG